MKRTTPQVNFLEFRTTTKTVLLSTVTSDGKPNSSYSPFVNDKQGNFYIFVSQLASHTRDLLERPQACILLIQDEAETRQIFARQRISYQCQVETISKGNDDYRTVLDDLEKRFGNVVALLRKLPDFILFRLRPFEGQYVEGFGKAYKLVGDGLLALEHINPVE